MKKIIGISIICFTVSGCAGGAFPLVDVILTTISGADFVTRTTTDKGIVDHGLDEVTGKDCKVSNIIKDKEICEDNLIKQMEELNCDTFRFKEDGEVYCVEETRYKRPNYLLHY